MKSFIGERDGSAPGLVRPLAAERLRLLTLTVTYLLLYVLLDALSYVRPVLDLGITPWNPEAGLTLAFLLTVPPRYAIATGLAALTAEIFVHDNDASWIEILAASTWIALGYAALAAVLRRAGISQPIVTSSAAARFAVAALLITLAVAAGYVAIFAASGYLTDDLIDDSVMRYWVGDLNGVLTLTPILLCLNRWREAYRAILQQRWLVLAQVGAVLLTIAGILGFFATHQLRDFHLVFVPIVWIALQWGVAGAVLTALAIQVGLIIGLTQSSLSLLDLQFLMLTFNATALLLGAAITERASVLRRVAAQEAEQRALLAMAPDAVLAVNPRGRILSSNAAALRLFGQRADPSSGSLLTQLLPAISLLQPEGRATLEGRRADETLFPAEIAWARLEAPASAGFLVIVRDATERRHAEMQLRERDTALARAMRFAVAGELASALTHELNQPITALVSYLRASEIMAERLPAGDERVRDTLGKATREAIRASQVLRRLRDFYQSGSVKTEVIHADTLCQAIAQAFQDRLRRARIELSVRLPADLPAVQADATHLEVVLHNLLSNAIDAIVHDSQLERRIELSADVTDEALRLHIEDSGPGVGGDVLEQLFEPFTTSKVDGMGLGLAISRSLLRSQGGDLTFERSRQLSGACFTIHLPRASMRSQTRTGRTEL